MFIGVSDGTAVFATHFIRLQYDRTDEGVREKMARFQLEKEGVVVYGNLPEAEGKLIELNLPYTVEVLDYKVHKPKAQGIIYQSRTEAINHLLYDAEPASQVIPNMKKKLADKDKEIAEMKQKYADLEGRMKKLEGKQTPI